MENKLCIKYNVIKLSYTTVSKSLELGWKLLGLMLLFLNILTISELTEASLIKTNQTGT